MYDWRPHELWSGEYIGLRNKKESGAEGEGEQGKAFGTWGVQRSHLVYK